VRFVDQPSPGEVFRAVFAFIPEDVHGRITINLGRIGKANEAIAHLRIRIPGVDMRPHRLALKNVNSLLVRAVNDDSIDGAGRRRPFSPLSLAYRPLRERHVF
jgi:hypothetical protein